MGNIKVSVIMPVYNVEEFLDRTLGDVLDQTLTDIEVICVDDGSTDASREIIKKYQKKDSRLQLIEQKNQYAGVARNNGLQHAKGKYVVFWDSDDMFQKKALEIMYMQSEKMQSDICICAANRYDNSKQMYIASDAYLRKKYLPKQELFNKFDIPEYIFNLATNVPWNKMFRREFLNQNRLQFQAIKQANDTYFTLMAFFLAERITYVEDVLISYRVNNNTSLSGKASDTVFCAYESYLCTLEEMEKHEQAALVKRSFLNRAISGFYHAMNIQTTFAAYRSLYEKLVSEGFARFELLDKEREFFYDKWMYDDMQKMRSMSPEDFMLQKSMSRRLSVEKAKSEYAKMTEKYEKEIESLSDKLETLKNRNQELENCFSYRLGRTLTKPVRVLRDK